MVCSRVWAIWGVWCALGWLIAVAGCGRRHYLRQADRETYRTLAEKTDGMPWSPPSNYSVYPDPRSRFADPTDPAFPQLPPVGPRLYRSGFLDDFASQDESGFRLEQLPPGTPVGERTKIEPPRPADGASVVRWAAALLDEAEDPSATGAPVDERVYEENRTDNALRLVPVDAADWEALPESCRRWMLEFEMVRTEFERTYDRSPTPAERVEAPSLSLDRIFELALIHSREYQSQKEALYRAALRLTLERYSYALRFDPFGNGTVPNWVHDRDAGITVNSLRVPTTLAGGKIMATGADLVARFANDVVLTFNGPSGFSADVGSQLVLQLSQSLLQNDIVFERLTQAERDVVYAARDFARFRKTFFANLTNRYYSLLLTYRAIAIGSQDYFSTSRAFRQGQAELKANRIPRFQVDQFEQNALRSRSSLIRSCNTLERALDDFKLLIGLPPELLIHVDLSELERLTAYDEATVREELVRRAQKVLEEELKKEAPDPSVVFAQAMELAKRLSLLKQADARSGRDVEAIDEHLLERLTTELRSDEAWYTVHQLSLSARASQQANMPIVQRFQRTLDLATALRIAMARERRRRLVLQLPVPDGTMDVIRKTYVQVESLHKRLGEAVANRQLDEINVLAGEAEKLLEATRRSAQALQRIDEDSWSDSKWLRGRVAEVLDLGNHVLQSQKSGLVPIDIEHDDALLTAVARRWDLANQREQVADAWRQIKLAADRLRAVIDVDAGQTMRTPSAVNRAFDFSWDDSTTQLRLNFDTPLNRQSERNAYRQALISYQQALRSWIEAEDRIKRDVRDDLRRLRLDRQQYSIAVASAALAQERVVSTRLQLQLGIGRVAARDFLEAQQAYTASLSSVAAEHIGFLTDRIALFLDLEQLVVDDQGMWPFLYEEGYQPEADFRLDKSSPHPYGPLVPGLWYSPRMREMLRAPELPPTIVDDP